MLTFSFDIHIYWCSWINDWFMIFYCMKLYAVAKDQEIFNGCAMKKHENDKDVDFPYCQFPTISTSNTSYSRDSCKVFILSTLTFESENPVWSWNSLEPLDLKISSSKQLNNVDIVGFMLETLKLFIKWTWCISLTIFVYLTSYPGLGL